MRKAFTLMELMVVIMILGLLTAIVVPNLVGQSERARRDLVCIQMKTIGESLNMFRADFGNYPQLEEGIDALIKNPDSSKYKNYPNGGYLSAKSTPKDSWGTEYIYVVDNGNFDIISLGRDKKEGGDGDDEDIYFSKCQE
ncbi:MAG: type II secretion system major pseudopilin GspG [Campylobacteraceae bacterium]|nr:type II secretion system major pseudopilin GspG [Campylobacteraceae bacterium]